MSDLSEALERAEKRWEALPDERRTVGMWYAMLSTELRRDRDGTPRRREAAEGEACQPGPPEEEASPNG